MVVVNNLNRKSPSAVLEEGWKSRIKIPSDQFEFRMKNTIFSLVKFKNNLSEY